MKYLLFIIVFASFLACNFRTEYNDGIANKHSACFQPENKLEYATGFTISHHDNFTGIIVYNPWSTKDTLASYILVKSGKKEDYEGLADFVIDVPVNKIAVLSTVCVGMFNLLKESGRIIACNNSRLIYDSVLYTRFLTGSLINLGDSPEMDAEAVIGASPELLMKYIFGGKDMNDQRIAEAGIPIAYNLEFMESHPLGRAEWIKFAAAFVGKEIFADSVFGDIRNQYLKYSALAAQSSFKPSVLDGSGYNGIWYAAGGKSFPAQLYSDAGAIYYWSSDSGRGSIPLNFEAIIDKQASADYWIGPSTGSRKQLLDIDSRYQLLKPFRESNVFYFGKRTNVNGGLDYYESGVTRPDILLKDLLWVFHPELLDSLYQPVYLERLKD
jgi:iron complex transport system substrate-binding protein